MKNKRRKYWRETRLNKIVVLVLLLVGILSTRIDNDATFLVFTLFFSVPLFFAKENWIG